MGANPRWTIGGVEREYWEKGITKEWTSDKRRHKCVCCHFPADTLHPGMNGKNKMITYCKTCGQSLCFTCVLTPHPKMNEHFTGECDGKRWLREGA